MSLSWRKQEVGLSQITANGLFACCRFHSKIILSLLLMALTSYLCVVCAEAVPAKTGTRSHRTGQSCHPDWTGWCSVKIGEERISLHWHFPTVNSNRNDKRHIVQQSWQKIPYHKFALIKAVLSWGEDWATVCATILWWKEMHNVCVNNCIFVYVTY